MSGIKIKSDIRTLVSLILKSRDENIDDRQQIGVKFERTFLKFATVDSISDRLKICFKCFVT